MFLDPTRLAALEALLLGFTFAGLCCSAFEGLAKRPVELALLRTGDGRALLCVPVLVFAGPLVIVRSLVSGAGRRRRTFASAFVATIVAGLWSLASGRLVLDLALAVTAA